MFPTSFFPAAHFPGSYFPPGAAVDIGKEGAAPGIIRKPLRQLLEIINAPDQPVTQFSQAFKKAATQSITRAQKEAVIRSEIKDGRLQVSKDLGTLSNEDLTLILLLMME